MNKARPGDRTFKARGWVPRAHFEREFPPSKVDNERARGEFRRFGRVLGVHESIGTAVEFVEATQLRILER